jgi:hypothetical protein
MAEMKQKLQDFVLQLLDKEGEIKDTAGLKFEGSLVDQFELLGVLNALKSRKVGFS